MKITFANHVLAPGDLEGVKGLSVNGEQLIDEAAFFRALATTYYARGNEKTEISFTVTREHASLKLAEVFVLMLRRNLPREGDCVITCGFTGDEQKVALLDAVLAPTQARYSGRSSIVTYTLLGGLPETDEIPNEEEIDPDVTRRGTVALGNGVTSASVAFLTAMTGAPYVTCNVVCPSGGDAIFATIVDGTVSASGFDVILSGPTPAATYKLSYHAIL